MKTIARIAAAAALFACAPAFAQDGDDYKFLLENRSSSPVTMFQTVLQNGQWSSNWIKVQIAPGKTFTMNFHEGDERCEVRTRIKFADGSEFDTPVDYCGITRVIATDETLYSE